MDDQTLIAAYQVVFQRHRVSVDELLATPACRELFLAVARESTENQSERDLLMRLIALRKRSKLPCLRRNDCSKPEVISQAQV